MEVEDALEDEWSFAALAFQHGGRRRTASALRNALDKTPIECSLQRGILHVNEHATEIAPSQKNVPPAPPHIFVPNESPQELQLLAGEAALTAAYNTALALLRTGTALPAALCLDQALGHVSCQLSNAYYGKSRKPCRGKRSWEEVAALASAARLDEDIFCSLPQGLSVSVRRWAEAAAAAFELRGAAALCIQDTESTAITAEAARSLRALAVAELARHSSRKENELLFETPQPTGALNRGDTEIQSEAPENALTMRKDDEAARGDWLLALAGGLSGNWESALEAVLDRGREAEPSTTGDATGYCHLPSAYMTGALLVIRGGSAEQKETAAKILDTCAARGYRTADCLALIARLKCGSKAVSAWQRVVALDYKRRAALWLAARQFGACGRVAQQAELLRCLLQVMALQDAESQKDKEISLVCMESGLRTKCQLSEWRVKLAHASALCSSEQWGEAVAVLADVAKESDDPLEIDGAEDSLRKMMGTLQAWAAAGTGDIEGGITRSEWVVDMYGNDGGWAACAHAGRGEALLRVERVKEACDALLASFRAGTEVFRNDGPKSTLLRGVCFHNLGVARYCLGKEAIADECFAAAQAAFEKCETRAVGVGMRETAKQFAVCASFARCVAMWARGRKVDAAAHWVAKREMDVKEGGRGMEGKKKSDVVSEEKGISSHVKGDIDEITLRKMDEVCADVCRGEDARRRLAMMMEEVQREWSMAENNDS